MLLGHPVRPGVVQGLVPVIEYIRVEWGWQRSHVPKLERAPFANIWGLSKRQSC